MKSFKERTKLFWEKFSEQEKEIRQLIDNISAIDSKELIDKVGNIVSVAFTDQPFELGHNTESNKYELIFSPNGNETILMQLMYLVEAMPNQLQENWTTYSSSPFSHTSSQSLELHIKDQRVKVVAEDFKITTHLNSNAKKINLDISIPVISELPENDQYRIIFLMMDRCISEIYTMKYIGEVNIVEEPKKGWLQKAFKKEDKNKDSIPLSKLKAFIDYLITDNDWDKPNYPYESWSVYKMKPPLEETSFRKDIFIGTTNSMSLTSDILSGETDIYPIKQLSEDGISLMYLYFSNEKMENPLETRNEVEDKLVPLIVDTKIAVLMGTAMGNYHAYLDYMVFDRDAFVEIVSSLLQDIDSDEKGIESIRGN